MNLSFGLRRKLRKEPDTNVGDQNRVPSSHGSSSQGFIWLAQLWQDRVSGRSWSLMIDMIQKRLSS